MRRVQQLETEVQECALGCHSILITHIYLVQARKRERNTAQGNRKVEERQ